MCQFLNSYQANKELTAQADTSGRVQENSKTTLLESHADIKVFHIKNYITEGQMDQMLFYLSEIKLVKIKSDKKD